MAQILFETVFTKTLAGLDRVVILCTNVHISNVSSTFQLRLQVKDKLLCEKPQVEPRVYYKIRSTDHGSLTQIMVWVGT